METVSAYRTIFCVPFTGSGNKHGIMFICKRSDEIGSASAGTQGSCCSTPDDRRVWNVCGMYLAGESHRETCSNATLCPAYSPWPAKDWIRVSMVKFQTNQRPKLCYVHHDLSDSFVLLSPLPYTVDKKGKQVLTRSLAMLMVWWQVKPRTICPKVWNTSERVDTLHSREMLCLL